MSAQLVGEQSLLLSAVPLETRAEGAEADDVDFQRTPGVQGDAEALAARDHRAEVRQTHDLHQVDRRLFARRGGCAGRLSAQRRQLRVERRCRDQHRPRRLRRQLMRKRDQTVGIAGEIIVDDDARLGCLPDHRQGGSGGRADHQAGARCDEPAPIDPCPHASPLSGPRAGMGRPKGQISIFGVPIGPSYGWLSRATATARMSAALAFSLPVRAKSASSSSSTRRGTLKLAMRALR